MFVWLFPSTIVTSIIVLNFYLFPSLPLTSKHVIVDTKLGKVKGNSLLFENGKHVNEFIGIRYGQPPVGELRFEKSLPVENLSTNGIYDATKEKNSCMQADVELSTVYKPKKLSEDCLFLNIWQPIIKTQGKEIQLPVMFWIHGGTFAVGTIFCDMYNGSYIASLGEVIVVTANYRLNSFGLLYGDSEDAPGNVGLHDQLLAMKWVKDNIASFGGDPDSITIFGSSAGAWSVGFHVLSPLAKGLFQRAILQSGAPNTVIARKSKDNEFQKMKNFAKTLNCNHTLISDQLECLKSKPASELVIHDPFMIMGLSKMFSPIYGDEFLPLEPSDALKRGILNHVDLLFGHTSDEGSIIVIRSITNPINRNLEITLAMANEYINRKFSQFGYPSSVAKEVAEFLFKGLTDDNKTQLAKAVSSLAGDFQLSCPTVTFGTMAGNWNKNNYTFAYKLAQPLSQSIEFPFIGERPEWFGAHHGEDLPFIFGLPLRDKTRGYTEDDKQFSKDMIQIWTHFAKTGQVPPPTENVIWKSAIDPKDDPPRVRYMQLKANHFEMIENGYEKTCEGFWKKFIR